MTFNWDYLLNSSAFYLNQSIVTAEQTVKRQLWRIYPGTYREYGLSAQIEKEDGPLGQEGSQAPSAKEAEFISNFFSK